jgi:hypothetical protein
MERFVGSQSRFGPSVPGTSVRGGNRHRHPTCEPVCLLYWARQVFLASLRPRSRCVAAAIAPDWEGFEGHGAWGIGDWAWGMGHGALGIGELDYS